MSALAEALVAAQRRALTALEKQAVAGKVDGDAAREVMNAIGCTDAVDQDRLLACLDVLRDYGAPLPAEPSGNGEQAEKPPEKASDAQKAYILRLMGGGPHPVLASQDLAALSKARAHDLIEALKAGTYDPTEFDVPF